MTSNPHDPDETLAEGGASADLSDSRPLLGPLDDEETVVEDSGETLTEDDDAATIADEVGEDTMDSVELGMYGSRPIEERGSGSEPVEAELVEDFDSSEQTIAMGDETLAEIHSKSGARQLGDFELERKIGQGGMGEVWLARQISLDRPVAVKVLPRTLATQENFIERFQREAKAAASLVHPNVIQIYAYGIDEGTPYFAMEYVEGEDLQQRMRRVRQLEWDEIVDVMVGVGNALHVAHQKGLIHRDIKPSNVMIDKNGIVKVMDFGLAKATTGGPETKSLTNAGLIMGTPNYLSPEQGRGDPLDGRSDLYSVGIVLYELLTGSLPFRADTPAGLIFKHVYEPPPPPHEIRDGIPPFLVEITLKLLEKDPDDRYANAQEFLADLAEFMDNYDYYVAEAGERRPESGYLDPERMKGFSQSISGPIKPRGRNRGSSGSGSGAIEKKNAVTEPVTRAVPTEPDPEPASVERPPVREPEPEPEPVRVPEDMPPRRPIRPEPVRRSSKAPLLIVAAILVTVGGWFWFQKQNPERAHELLVQFGLARSKAPQVGVKTGEVTKTGEATKTGEPTKTGPGPVVPKGEGLEYQFPVEKWPERTKVQLLTPENAYDLRRGAADRFPLRSDYRLSLRRPGYEAVEIPVKLVRSREDNTKGQLLDKDGAVASESSALTWKPTAELVAAYTSGRDALDDGDLKKARTQLEAAKELDPGYRLEEGDRDVEQLLAALSKKERAAAASSGQVQQVLDLAQQQIDRKAYREALDTLSGVKATARDTSWTSLKTACTKSIEQGEGLREAVEDAIREGKHTLAASKLDELKAVDPQNPKKGPLEERLKNAKLARADAMKDHADPKTGKALLESYLKQFGAGDLEAKQRLKEVAKAVTAQEELTSTLAELRALKKKGRWAELRRRSNELLRAHPASAEAQELRRVAEQELSRSAIEAVVTELDTALLQRDVDRLVRVLDPTSEVAKTEKDALARLAEIQGRFTKSEHRHLKIRMDGEFAQVEGEWRFSISILGEPVQEMQAQHKLQLKLVDKRWLLVGVEVLKGREGIRRVE